MHPHASIPRALYTFRITPCCMWRAGADHKRRETICVVDMGLHLLPLMTGARLVLQMLVPGLEDRARALPPLRSLRHTPGK